MKRPAFYSQARTLFSNNDENPGINFTVFCYFDLVTQLSVTIETVSVTLLGKFFSISKVEQSFGYSALQIKTSTV